MIKRKKGQAALEFLMTYGWAFLVILIMVGALTYFGVLDFKQWIPNKCEFGAHLGCKNTQFGIFSASETSKAVLTNNYGRDINVSTFTVSSDQTGACPTGTADICIDLDENAACTAADINITAGGPGFIWQSGRAHSIVVQCTATGGIFVVGEKNKMTFQYNWYDTASGPSYMRTGSGIIQSEVYP